MSIDRSFRPDTSPTSRPPKTLREEWRRAWLERNGPEWVEEHAELLRDQMGYIESL